MKKRQKSCLNCSYCRCIAGEHSDYHKEPDIIDCLNPDVDYRLIDRHNTDTLPGVCKNYKAKLIKACSYCQEVINQPIYNWLFWVEDIFENLPVCSSFCQKKLQEKLDTRTDNFHDDGYPF